MVIYHHVVANCFLFFSFLGGRGDAWAFRETELHCHQVMLH